MRLASPILCHRGDNRAQRDKWENIKNGSDEGSRKRRDRSISLLISVSGEGKLTLRIKTDCFILRALDDYVRFCFPRKKIVALESFFYHIKMYLLYFYIIYRVIRFIIIHCIIFIIIIIIISFSIVIIFIISLLHIVSYIYCICTINFVEYFSFWNCSITSNIIDSFEESIDRSNTLFKLSPFLGTNLNSHKSIRSPIGEKVDP